jgi:DivIVA domain-containing protein
MEWFIAVVAIAALGVAAMAAAGGVGEMSPEPVYDVYRQQLPEAPLDAEAIRGVRFGLALRGYAMDQVDDLLDRLAAEIADRDARIAELGGSTALPLPDGDLGPGPDGAPPAPASPAHLTEDR